MRCGKLLLLLALLTVCSLCGLHGVSWAHAPFAPQQDPDAMRSQNYTARPHLQGGLTCNDCHGDGPKKPVDQARCRQCHGDFKDVAPLTSDDQPNPHNNHLTASLQCTDCHRMHAPPVMVCQRCHEQMQFVRPKKAAH